ncbi:MAG: hypothetical protein AAGG69_09545 [Pseudomonadota bacterium]
MTYDRLANGVESQILRDNLREAEDSFAAEIVNPAPCDDGKWNSENETITEINYARMTQEDARCVFQTISDGPTLLYKNKELYIALLEATLTPGTP